ncbi:hypothetical protein CXG81DRAFT_13454 [Caulochytrium protostelioides]|uniref:Protein kinase domain-containing protein n=1 Tax=Caulochytrium protostelioides TaxID=1555241 RepID=A0A4V1IUE2_9FUNG|nr:hypothetical protein CXG81DRAFT_13454 [Caulochytrium protostelioides]|eukprot:RKP00249.1 hypothetical protein CXG81DRAFT_13454 [Caulochytrium protostelioides]
MGPASGSRDGSREDEGETSAVPDEIQRITDHETQVWSQLHHPKIVEMIEVMDVEDATFIVSELMGGGCLLTYIRQKGVLPELEAKMLFRQVATAVHYLHSDVRLIHRDLKCENVLLDETRTVAKIADFGLSQFLHPPVPEVGGATTHGTGDDPFCQGSLHYCAPEELAQTDKHTPASDIWSLGCILYAMLTGELPFSDDFLPRLQARIVQGKYDEQPLVTAGVSESAQSLVRAMLTVDTASRASAAAVLTHPWLQFPSGLS